MIGRSAFRLQSVLLGALFGVLAILTWQRSGDLLIDWGRELYTALSVSEGRGIPFDVLLLFGPVSPLINGTVFRLAGERTGVLLVSNLVFLSVALVLVYDIANRLFGRRSAFLCSVVFLFLSGFPHLVRVGNYSFLTPYSHGLTHGLVLGFIVAAARHLTATRADWELPVIAMGIASLFLTVMAVTDSPVFDICVAAAIFLICAPLVRGAREMSAITSRSEDTLE